MNADTAYPSLGEVVKYLFDVTGVLARKGDIDSTFDETKKRNTQKKLQRIANEDGELQSQFDDLAKIACELLSHVIRCPIAACQVSTLINDLYDRYKHLITEQGTYMSKKDTVRFFLTHYAVDIAVRSLIRDWLKYQPLNPTASRPDQEFWYLPSEQEKGWAWPLAHALKWAYRICDVSQAQFHSPSGDKTVHQTSLLEKHLKSASRWTSGEAVPSMFVLVKNLEASFQAQAANGRPVEDKLQHDIVTVVALARIATDIAKGIEHVYGAAFLRDTIKQIKSYVTAMRIETDEFYRELGSVSTRHSQSDDDINELRIKMTAHFMAFFEAKCDVAKELMDGHTDSTGIIKPEVVDWIEKRYGTYAALVPIDCRSRWKLDKPECFEALMSTGFSMLNGALSYDDIDCFAAAMQSSGVDSRAPWLVHWLRGAFYYRSKNDAEAWPHYKKAYETAKYSAGRDQYILVNQYLEMAAKNGRWLDFKKGALWACYLGISVRWLREDEPNDENLRSVFNLMGMKKLRYAK